MPTRVRYQQWTRQPQAYARIIPEIDMARSMVWCPGVAISSDITGRSSGGLVGGAYSTSHLGRSVSISGATQRWETNSGAGLAFGAAEAKSFLVYLRYTGGSSFRYALSIGDGWALALSHASFGDRAAVYDGTTIRDTGVSVPTGINVAMMACHSGSSGELRTYINGVLVSTNTGVTGSAIASSLRLIVGNTGITNNDNAFGDYVLGALLAGDLSAYGREITSSPWQLFAPRRLLVPVSAGGGIPTLSAATVFAITANSAQPRVTVAF